MDKGLKQRIVGALVLVALAVIFVPMLFSRPDEVREVVVDAPPMPATPAMPSVELQPVVVPEPEPLPPDPTLQVPEAQTGAEVAAPAAQPAVEPPPAVAPVPAAAVAEAPASRLDANSLPVSWSVQLASLSSRSSAEALQQSLRSKGYNAYVRSFEGMNRVFVGPVLERAEADRLRDQIKRQQKLEGFVVRFQPETR
jgi:DedD protein